MKGLAGATGPSQPKRRWRCVAGAVGLALLFFSLVVPLAVLLGLHARFPSGESGDDRSASEERFVIYEKREVVSWENKTEVEDSRISDLVERLAPDFKKDWTENTTYLKFGSSSGSHRNVHASKSSISSSYPSPVLRHMAVSKGSAFRKASSGYGVDSSDERKEKHELGLPGDENTKSCQLQYGSYCIWSVEHRTLVKDSAVKMLKDQLFVARAYYPSIAKLDGKEKLALEMKLNIQEYERMLSDAISDSDLPLNYGIKMEKMGLVIAKAKSCRVECQNVEKKFRQLLDLTENEADFHMRQSAFIYRLNAQTLPKSFHCLSMMLTIDYFNSFDDNELLNADKLRDPDLQHFIIFSTNLLAASITINSTVMSSVESDKLIFHIITDGENYYSFKRWFAKNFYNNASVETINLEHFRLKNSDGLITLYQSPSEDFRITSLNTARSSQTLIKTDYVSVFGHSVFLLPDVFKDLKKVILLEDDIIVQTDLSFLWNLNLEGNAMSATEFCQVRLKQLRRYLGNNAYNPHSCVWMSGLNVLDLEKWRRTNMTGIHRDLLQKMHHGSEASWKAAALPASLLALHNLVLPMNRSWIQSGLGHDYDIAHGMIRKAAVLHYNGNRKPWLDLGIQRYKKYWKKYQPRDELFLVKCNVNP